MRYFRLKLILIFDIHKNLVFLPSKLFTLNTSNVRILTSKANPQQVRTTNLLPFG